ncbi:MAG: threonine synthase [Cyanobacteria bacterium P01_H01_bin.74]
MAGILARYRKFYDFDEAFQIVSLEEGSTPLIPAPAVAELVNHYAGATNVSVFLKFEGLNPTGSFKDRGMTYAVSRALSDGHQHIICASTGNTSASAAAYGARAGLNALIILPAGKVALGKLSQAILYGAAIVEIEGNFDQALEIVRDLGASGKACVVNSINPYRIEGQKTGAFELCDALGRAPDDLYIPVGNAGNITAYWKGFKEYADAGVVKNKPRMNGFEAEGAAAIALNRKIDSPETFATAIRIGNPASWAQAEAARDESGGQVGWVTDAEIAEAYRILAAKEGVFCEPSSAASVAGLFKTAKAMSQKIQSNSQIVCVLTGNGLKDPDSAIQYGNPKRATLPADSDAVADFFGL